MSMSAVIFDMDGVLTATVEHHYQSWKKALDGYEIAFSREKNEKLLGLTRRRSLEVILEGKQLAEEEMQAILDRKNRFFLDSLETMNPADLLPGVRVLLEELKEAGIRTGVASGSRNAAAVLERLGIESLIDVICDGSATEQSKPAPDIFLKTAQALGVSPNACLVIEDSEAGVQAGLKAGMCVIGLGPELRLRHSHAVFASLTQVNFRILGAIYDLWAAVTGINVPLESESIDMT